MSAPSRRVSVDLGARSYEIAIGEGLLDEPSLLQPWLRGREVCLVSNETLAPRYFPRIEALLPPGSRVTHFTMGDGERFKSFETLTALLDTLLAERHSRATTLIAIGGGVVGDLTGFAAAIYQRGVAFIQVPTTLLAQVDALRKTLETAKKKKHEKLAGRLGTTKKCVLLLIFILIGYNFFIIKT